MNDTQRAMLDKMNFAEDTQWLQAAAFVLLENLGTSTACIPLGFESDSVILVGLPEQIAKLLPAAANKAAEEGGLPALREIWNQLDDLRQISSQGSLEDTERTNARLKKIGDIQNFVRAEINNGIYRDQLREDTKRRGLMGQVFTGHPGSLAESWYQEGAADRASRQVANKAEVESELRAEIEKLTRYKHCMSYNDSYFGEPVGLVKQVAYQLNRLISAKKEPTEKAYSEKLAKRGAPAAEVRAAERVEAMHKGVVGVLAGIKAEAIDTPPATTGASTVQTIDTPEFQSVLKAYRNSTVDFAERKAHLIAYIDQHFKGSVGASTVLTDERIAAVFKELGVAGEPMQNTYKFARAIEREVAAQAGQVAVPASLIWDAITRLESRNATIEERFAVADALLAIAPSPAKESK